jgi:hypothetical protein
MEYTAFRSLYKDIKSHGYDYEKYLKLVIKEWAKCVLVEDVVTAAIKLITPELVSREYDAYYWVIYYGIITKSLKVELIENLTVTKIKTIVDITDDFPGIDTLPSTIHELISFRYDGPKGYSLELLLPSDILSITFSWQTCCELKHTIAIAKFLIINQYKFDAYKCGYRDIVERARTNPGIISEDYLLEMSDMHPY